MTGRCRFAEAATDGDRCKLCAPVEGDELYPWDYARHAIGMGASEAAVAAAFAERFVLPVLRSLRDGTAAAIEAIETQAPPASEEARAKYDGFAEYPKILTDSLFMAKECEGQEGSDVALLYDMTELTYVLGWLRLDGGVEIKPRDAYRELERAAAEWGPRLLAAVQA